MSRFGQGILASLEDEEEVVAVVETPEEVADAVIEGAEEAPAEAEVGLQEADQDLEETVEKVEEIDEAVDELEEVKEAVESFLEEGGMNRQAAKMFNLRIQRLNTRLLGKGRGVAVPSVESFGTAGSAYAATTDSLEAIADLLAKAKDAIHRAIEWVKAKAKEFYRWAMDFAGRQAKSLASLKEAAGKVTGTTEGEVDGATGLAKQLHVGGKVGAEGIKASFTAVSKEYVNLMKSRSDAINKVAAALTDTKDIADAQSKMEDASKAYSAVIGRYAVDLPGIGKAIIGGTEFCGGLITYKASAGAEVGTPAAVIDSVFGRTGLVAADKKRDEEAAKIEKLPALKQPEMIACLDAAIAACETISKASRTIGDQGDAFNGALKSFSTAADKLKSGVDKEDAKGKEYAKFLTKVAAKLPRASRGAPEELASSTLKSAKALSVYVAKSMKLLESKPKAAEAA